MKELVIDIVKALVDNPDEVTVEETRKKGEIILKLSVSQEDMGKVIGKGLGICLILFVYTKNVKRGDKMTEKLTVFRIGQIVNTQGLKGEVRVYPYTDDINRFDELEYFYIDKNLNNKYEVERVRYKGNMVIMKIKDIDSIELAEKLKTKNMYIGREQGRELDEGEFFVSDLIGLDVFTVDGEKVGVLKDVLQHAINDVYVVSSGEKEYLIPSIEKFVPTIDLDQNKMIIDPIKGMLD